MIGPCAGNYLRFRPRSARMKRSMSCTAPTRSDENWPANGELCGYRGVQNFLVNIGARKGGLCFQWAGELLSRLDALRLQTLDLHWAESYAGTSAEHNVIVVTARGQPFERGILLDNWRYGGHLVYGRVAMDPEYRWTENPAELARRLKANSTPAPQSAPATGETKRLMRR